MITENLSTLKIHKLSQAQYERELSAGAIDENALYLTPEDVLDIEDGGTGARDAATARENLGVASKEYVDALAKPVLLWENSAPTSEQTASTTTIDLDASNAGYVFSEYILDVQSLGLLREKMGIEIEMPLVHIWEPENSNGTRGYLLCSRKVSLRNVDKNPRYELIIDNCISYDTSTTTYVVDNNKLRINRVYGIIKEEV